MESKNTENNTRDVQVKKKSFFPRLVDQRHYLWVVGVFTLIGVVGGYAYYALIGCSTGGCAITSNPYMSMAYGGLLGYLMPGFFVRKEKPGK